MMNTLLMSTMACRALTAGLDSSLRQYRTEQAYIRAVPPASVFGNALLKRIVASKPCTLSALGKLRGIGQTRSAHYGHDIVRLVNLQARKKGQMRPKSLLPISTTTARGAKSTQRKALRGKQQKKTSKPKGKCKKSIISPAEKAKALIKGPKPKVVSRFFAKSKPPPAFFGKDKLKVPCKPPRTSVYVLELEDGRVYVGSSTDVQRRLTQHCNGYGSAYTKVYKPTGVLLPRLGNVEGDGDAAERDETLRYMMLRGIPYVRGWKFARVAMPEEEYEEAEANIRELFDLCRRCGYKGHFCTHCKATFDRLGNAIKK